MKKRIALRQRDEVDTEIVAGLDDILRKDPWSLVTDRAVQERFRKLPPERAALIRKAVEEADVPAHVIEAALGSEQKRAPPAASVFADVTRTFEPFHSPEREPYVDVTVNGVRRTLAVRSRDVKDRLVAEFYARTGKPPPREALQGAIDVLDAQAVHDGPERRVYRRVGKHEGRVYLDLGDDTWRAVEIDVADWRIVDEMPNARFVRSPGALPLPEPRRGGEIERLFGLINVRSEADRVLLVSVMTTFLRPARSYPIPVFSGPQGSAKSTSSRMTRGLIDPHVVPDRSCPRDEKELIPAVRNNHVLLFDNLSGLPAAVSDAFCRISTGSGFAPRALYSNDAEHLVHGARPIILNGIDDLVGRPDLADRSVVITLDAISEEERRPEAELWAAFEREQPYILGALLDGLVEGLRNLPHSKVDRLPRMADFALFSIAAETAHFTSGSFMAAYDAKREETVENVIEADAFASALRRFIGTRGTWAGTATQLASALAEIAGEAAVRSRSWPGDQRALGNRLVRVSTALRALGIEISHRRSGKAGTRIIKIEQVGWDGETVQAEDNVQPERGAAVCRLEVAASTETRERLAVGRARPADRLRARFRADRKAAE